MAFTTAATAASNVGSYAINGSGLTANNGNYTFAQAASNSTALTVNPATLTYTAAAASSIYGATPAGLSGTVTGFVNGQTALTATTGTLAFTTAATAASNVDSYAITGSGLTANNGNYIFAQAASNSTALTVNPRAVTLTGSQIYNGGTSVSAANLTLTDGVFGATAASIGLSGTGSVASPNVSAGSQALNLTGLSVTNGNYTVANGSGTETITPRPIVITALSETRLIGLPNPPLAYQIGGDGLVSGDFLTGGLTTPATGQSTVGTYSIVQGTLAAGSNYAVTFIPGTFTIQPYFQPDASTLASTTINENLLALGRPSDAQPFLFLPFEATAAPDVSLAQPFSDPRYGAIVVCNGQACKILPPRRERISQLESPAQ